MTYYSLRTSTLAGDVGTEDEELWDLAGEAGGVSIFSMFSVTSLFVMGPFFMIDGGLSSMIKVSTSDPWSPPNDTLQSYRQITSINRHTNERDVQYGPESLLLTPLLLVCIQFKH